MRSSDRIERNGAEGGERSVIETYAVGYLCDEIAAGDNGFGVARSFTTVRDAIADLNVGNTPVYLTDDPRA